MFNIKFLIIYLFIFIFFQCEPGKSSSSSSSQTTILSNDEFYFRNIDEEAKIIKFLKIGENNTVEIFIEETLKDETITTKGNEIASKFKNEITPIGDEYFGSPSDVDKNGKVTVLIVDLYQRYLENGGNSQNSIYTVGFFNPNETLFGNERGYNFKDILFMDSHIFKVNENTFYQTLIHEYQHLINWNERVLQSPDFFKVSLNDLNHELWLNEGLSVSSEHLYNNGFINSYIRKFSANYSNFISAITGGDKFIRWDKSQQLANYTTTYLFLQWLRIHSNSGHKIYKKLINDKKNNGADAIVELVKNEIPTLKGVGGGAPKWEDIFKVWNIAFYFNKVVTGNSLYNYKGKTSFPGFVTAGVNKRRLLLYPGESILMQHYNESGESKSVSDLTGIDDTLLYLSIKKSGDTLIIDDNTKNNYEYLLVINKSTNASGSFSSTIAMPDSSKQQINSKKENGISILSKKHSKIHSHGGVTHQHISQDDWLKDLDKIYKKK